MSRRISKLEKLIFNLEFDIGEKVLVVYYLFDYERRIKGVIEDLDYSGVHGEPKGIPAYIIRLGKGEHSYIIYSIGKEIRKRWSISRVIKKVISIFW